MDSNDLHIFIFKFIFTKYSWQFTLFINKTQHSMKWLKAFLTLLNSFLRTKQTFIVLSVKADVCLPLLICECPYLCEVGVTRGKELNKPMNLSNNRNAITFQISLYVIRPQCVSQCHDNRSNTSLVEALKIYHSPDHAQQKNLLHTSTTLAGSVPPEWLHYTLGHVINPHIWGEFTWVNLSHMKLIKTRASGCLGDPWRMCGGEEKHTKRFINIPILLNILQHIEPCSKTAGSLRRQKR